LAVKDADYNYVVTWSNLIEESPTVTTDYVDQVRPSMVAVGMEPSFTQPWSCKYSKLSESGDLQRGAWDE
jgi:hypothetical protein